MYRYLWGKMLTTSTILNTIFNVIDHDLNAIYHTSCRCEACGLSCAFTNAVHSLVFSTQTSMNAWRTMAAVITSAGTQWAPSNAAARKATNCSLMNGHAKVSD